MKIRFLTQTAKKTGLLLLLAAAASGLALILNPRTAAADTNTVISGEAPIINSGDYYYDQTYQGPYQGWFALSTGVTKSDLAWQKIYVPLGAATTITIQNGGGYCYSQTDPTWFYWAYDQYTPDTTYTIQDLDANENTVAGGATFSQSLSSLGPDPVNSPNTTCRNLTMTIPAAAGVKSAIYGHGGYRVFLFMAKLNNPDCGATIVCSVGKLFRMNSTGGALIGFSRSVNVATQNAVARPFGVSAKPLYELGPPLYVDDTNKINPPPYNWTYSFQFAPRCDEDDPSSNIYIYDADNGVVTYDSTTGYWHDFEPQYLSADLYWDSKNQPGFNWNLQNSWTADQLGPYGVDLAQSTLSFPTTSFNRYKLYMKRFNYRNIIQFYIPLDQFDADTSYVNCFVSTCELQQLNSPTGVASITSRTSGTATAVTGQGISVKIRMSNIGAGPWLYEPPDSLFGLGQVSPPSNQLYSFDPSRPPPIEPGSDAIFNFSIVRGSPVTNLKLTFQMQDGGVRWFGETCDITITFIGPPVTDLDAGCQRMAGSVSDYSYLDPVPTRLVFSSANAPTVTYDFDVPNNAAGPNPGQFNFDTFNTITDLRPHVSYTVQMYVRDNARSPLYVPAGPQRNLAQCLRAQCLGLSETDFEPGEARDVTYGIRLTNATGRTFPAGWYSVQIFTVGAGLTTNPSPVPQVARSVIPTSIDLGSPPNNNFTAAFVLTANYQSGLTASLFFQGANINAPFYAPGLPCVTTVTPKTRPYVQVWQGDTRTGGGFKNNNQNCVISYPNYVAPLTSSPYYPFAGGIRTYNEPATGRGSLSEFGVFSLGLISFVPSSKTGFNAKASFANINIPAGAAKSGFLNSNLPSYCVINYYGVTKKASSLPFFTGGSLTGLPGGQYNATPLSGDLVLAASTIAAGKQITLFTDSDVLITGDIVNQAKWDPNVPNNAPYLAIVSKGNIRLTNAVTRLDGLFIAQPDMPGVGGEFLTCDGFCNKQLVINGSVIARHVRLLRAHGTVLSTASGNVGNKPAEIINFTPSVLLGQPDLLAEPYGFENTYFLPPAF